MSSRQCPLCASPVPPGAHVCPTCGAPLDAEATSASNPDLVGLLASGTTLNKGSFSIGKLLGRGGFGITYLGADLRLKRPVAIKEFFPAGAVRQGTHVLLPGTLSRADYTLAIQKYLQEAQVLARFRHPSIVNVYEVFQENDTVYMVMEYLKGETLMERLERHGRALPEAELITITRPVTEALEEVHSAGVLHRDIKPQNIMLVGRQDAARPVLIDFGAAREFASGKANRHSIVLTPGYAPLEQYGEQARCGPFTDIYALAATLYHVATGEQPPAATERALGVALKPPRTLNPDLSVTFDQALLRGLEMKVDQRPQSALEFYQELAGSRPAPTPGFSVPATASPAPRTASPPPPKPAAAGHIGRVQQIARELAPGATVQTDRLTCPVCRAATMVDSALTPTGVKCPVCRVAALRPRLATSGRDRCPACKSGRLEPARPEVLKPGALMNCPACRVGLVMWYMKQRALFVPDAWARCDNCGADFDFHMQEDSLTLAELPGGPGRLSPSSIGETRTRVEWAGMSRGSAGQYVCTYCSSEFDTCAHGKLEWAARPGRPQVPAEHRGQCRTQLEWAKIAHNLPVSDGTTACPHCDAQFDETEPGHLTLLRASTDPYGTVARYRGRSQPVNTWRSIAGDRRDPSRPGFVCPNCTAELQDTLRGEWYTLASYDHANDPYGAGGRYYNQQLNRRDWQRIAAGTVPASAEEQLREEARNELWEALCAGELSPAEQSYPRPRAVGENVVVTFGAVQIRSQLGFFYEYDGGQIWLTTERLLYYGDQSTEDIPLAETSGCELQDVMQGYGPVVTILREGWAKPFRFVMEPSTLDLVVEGMDVRLPWDESSFAELYASLRRMV